jgi:hypothetical protein
MNRPKTLRLLGGLTKMTQLSARTWQNTDHSNFLLTLKTTAFVKDCQTNRQGNEMKTI